jgi:integrase/recombinase XerD
VADVKKDELQLFVKAAKGKKDRYTLLSESILPELNAYLTDYTPKHWLFEGQTGGRYSERSVQEIFRKAVTKSQVNPYATVHTLRHSFATHLVRSGTPLSVVQNLLGHADPKTTERYLHITTAHRHGIKSPLDDL